MEGIFDNIEFKNDNTNINNNNNKNIINTNYNNNDSNINKGKVIKENKKKMTIIQNNDPNIKNGFEDNNQNNNDNDNDNSINNNNNKNNDIEILEESRDYNTGGKYREKR